MIDDYLSYRWVIYEGDKWSLKDDDFLRMDLSAGTSIIGFADDALVVCAADDVGILEPRVNDSLWQEKRWLDSRGLKMAPEKTEALLVTERRPFQYPEIALEEHSEHTLFFCARWGVAREAVGREVGAQLTPHTMVSLMLQSEQKWTLIESFFTMLMKTRELDGRVERGNNGGQ